MPLHRSLLFAPAARPELMEKAGHSGADALIFDLEDSVPPAGKPGARINLQTALAKPGEPPIFVRVNHPSENDTAADIGALVGSRLAGILLPKAERTDEIHLVDRLLKETEERLGLAKDTLLLIPMIETCLGLRNAFELASAVPRIGGMCLASAEEGDFMLDLGGRWTPEGEALLYARGRLVCEGRAAGVEWLIDGVFMNLKDDDALRRESILARNMGYLGKMAIHPRQLPVLHEVFSPTAEEVDYAIGLVEAMRTAEAEGRGATQYRGMMVDYANLKRAKKVLERMKAG
ncbi:CoA ester lyase [Aquabacter sp. CN5-332]|uniref:HpcH/HpaI aldolase/citrate lyase family protein n=1 Tax=Aquabacter sp. CN5-332 TaxID=3156608 RepID=UPI0032B50454